LSDLVCAAPEAVDIDVVLANQTSKHARIFVNRPGGSADVPMVDAQQLVDVASLELRDHACLGLTKRWIALVRTARKLHILDAYDLMLAQYSGPLYAVFQFPYIARPVVSRQTLESLIAKARQTFIKLVGAIRQKVAREKRDVFTPLS
jgi:hypothetical protein